MSQLTIQNIHVSRCKTRFFYEYLQKVGGPDTYAGPPTLGSGTATGPGGPPPGGAAPVTA